jgi:hypothetical protein
MSHQDDLAAQLDALTDEALAAAQEAEQTGDIARLSAAIKLFTRVVHLGNAALPDRARHLDNLGVALLSRYELTHDRADLHQALEQARAATTHPSPHRDHWLHLSNLCNTALTWFDEAHDRQALNEAVAAGRAAVQGAASSDDVDDEDLGLFRENLRAALVRRFELNVADSIRLAAEAAADPLSPSLETAVTIGRAAVADVPDDEPRRWVALSNLSELLRLRYSATGSADDLDEAVKSAQQAKLFAQGDAAQVPGQSQPEVSSALNLAAALLTRYLDGGTRADADAVVVLCRTVAATAFAEPDRLLALSTLMGALQGRADPQRRAQEGWPEEMAWADLDEAVQIGEQLTRLARNPEERGLHLVNLANALLSRAQARNAELSRARARSADPPAHDQFLADLDRAVRSASAAVGLLAEGSPEWARAEANLASALERRWTVTRRDPDANQALSGWQAVAVSPGIAAPIRLAAASDASRVAAHLGRSLAAAELAGVAVELLPLLAWWGLGWVARAHQLSRWPHLAADAAALALADARPGAAAVLSDHGRAVLWGQLLTLRGDISAVQQAAPDLARRLARIQAQLGR